MSKKIEIAVFGGGCFWCTEAIFQSLKGIVKVTPGYAGGDTLNPTYIGVSSGKTGHAEVIKIEFDPEIIPYKELLDVFWHTHNPTTPNQQDADIGTQYRSIVLYTSKSQQIEAQKMLQQIKDSGEWKDPVITQIKPLDKFYEAENYHNDYYQKNQSSTYCQLVISPKLAHLREKYSSKVKTTS